MALDDDMAGGYSNYYDPAKGMMLVDPSQHQMFAQMMTERGAPVPPDFPDDFTHKDAHAIMQSSTKDQSRMPSSDGQLPQQGSFDERFSDAFHGPPGNLNAFTAPSGPRAGSSDTLNPKFPAAQGMGDDPTLPKPPQQIPSGPTDPMSGAPLPEGVPLPRSRPQAEQFGPEDRPNPSIPRAGEIGRALKGVGEKVLGTDNPDIPSRHPIVRYFQGKGSFPGTQREFEEQRAATSSGAGEAAKAAVPLKKPDEKPTAVADTPPTTGTSIPAGDTSEHPGGLNKEDPNAKTESAKEKKADKSNAWDSFGKALAGVSAMKPPTVQFPHPGNLPHPGSQLSRSTVPTEILKELSSIGHPGQLLRLGAALKGR